MTKDELNNKQFEVIQICQNWEIETVLFSKENISKDLLNQFNVWTYGVWEEDDELYITDSRCSGLMGIILCGERKQNKCSEIDGWREMGTTMTISEFLARYTPKFFKMEDDLKAQCINYMTRAVEANGPITFSDHNQPYINQMPITCVSIDDDGFFVAENAESNKLIYESAMNVANLFDLAKAVYNQTKDNKI